MAAKEALVNGGSTFVHPAALCESTSVGEGTRIWAFAHVLEGAIVGAHCNLGDHTFVEGGVTIGNRVTLKNGVAIWDGVVLYDDVFVGPNAVFTNDLAPRAAPHRTTADSLLPTVVRRGATIGANATVVCGVTIGAHALIGAGAVVTADVPSHGIVVGVPARQIGWICCCGARLSPPCRCRCGRELRVTAHGLRVVASVMQR